MAMKTDVATAVAFHDWFQMWDEQRTVSVSRQKADRTRYQNYVADRFGDSALPRITPAQVQDHIDRLLADGVGPFTVDAALAIIRGVLGLGVERGVLKRNAAAGIAVKQAEPFRRLEVNDVLTDEQVEALLEAMTPLFRPLVSLAANHGLSWSECLGLQVGDVNIRERRLEVGRITAVESSGKLTFKPGNRRTVFLSAEESRELAEHILSTVDYREKATEPWLFVTTSGTTPLRPNFNTHFLRPALERAGLDPRSITFHNLRHTAARRMLERGVTLEQVSSALGHKSLETTRRYYGHFVPPETLNKK